MLQSGNDDTREKIQAERIFVAEDSADKHQDVRVSDAVFIGVDKTEGARYLR